MTTKPPVPRDPHLNKPAAFTEAERQALGLVGLLPAGVDSEESQIRRILCELEQRPSNLEKYLSPEKPNRMPPGASRR